MRRLPPRPRLKRSRRLWRCHDPGLCADADAYSIRRIHAPAAGRRRRRRRNVSAKPAGRVSMLGVILLLLGALLLVAEAHVPSHGALGTAAVPALTAGVVLTLSGAGAAAG